MKKMIKLFGTLLVFASLFLGCSNNADKPSEIDDGETPEMFSQKIRSLINTEGIFSTDSNKTFKLVYDEKSFILMKKNGQDEYQYNENDIEKSRLFPLDLDIKEKIKNNTFLNSVNVLFTLQNNIFSIDMTLGWDSAKPGAKDLVNNQKIIYFKI